MCGAQDSKVVVTTRTKIVAQTMGVSVPYTLNGLTPEESWRLLKNIITYGDESKRLNQTLESIGKKIAEKCSGVPLAIRTLGGLLQGKNEERDWIDILQGNFWKLCEDEESIMPVLKLTYQNMSPQLRQCFSYCSLYPKDWEIQKHELIQIWMAQGYLECSTVGDQFVNILLMKSFFQDVRFDTDGGIYSFKMHDLIHDLAMQVAGNDCCYLDSGTKSIVGSPMHLMLKSDAIGLLESVDASKMRTLVLLFNVNSKSMNEKEWFVISKFKYLRVLKISYCSLSKFCNLFVKFKHLRYLNLCDCEGLGSLSKFISNIVCLQRLIIDACEDVEIYTEDVSKLINLRHLEIRQIKVFEEKKAPSGFRKLGMGERYKGVTFSNWFSPLANIVVISLYDCKGLKYLPPMERLLFLKFIYISFLDELEYIYYAEPLLSETFFPSLESLILWNCNKLRGWWRMNDNDSNPSQSHNLSFPPCLSFLTIHNCRMLTRIPTFPNLGNRLEFTDSNMETLEATLNMISSKWSIDQSPPLSKLKSLFLTSVSLDMKKLPENWVQNLTSLEHLHFDELPNQSFQEIGTWFKEDYNYLPSLQKIEISSCSDLKTLPGWLFNLSSLQHITIQYCQNIASLSEGMPRLAKLQTLEIIGCPLLVEDCKTQTSETWHKIAHIPNIILK